MQESARARAGLGPLAIVLLAVALQVTGALLLKTLADRLDRADLWIAGLGIGAVILLNLLRLAVWGFAHRRYPLSRTFPLSSLFFPAMLLVSVAYGEAVGGSQVAGALMITAGTCWLTWQADA